MAVIGFAAHFLKAQDGLPEAVLRASQIRRKAVETFRRNLSFSCLETITRFERRSTASAFHKVDSLSLEAAMVNGKELFSWPGERRFSDRPPMELVGAGLTTSGEVLANVENVLVSNNAVLSYVGEAEVHRTKAVQYRFSLSSLVSGYRVFGNDRSAAVATKGNIWANVETLELMRLDLSTEAIPPELGISSVVSRIDFAASLLGEQRVLLPDTATVTLMETNGRSSKNEISFSHFRQYSSESSLLFSGEGQTKNERIPDGNAEEYLPGGLRIDLKLTRRISVAAARLGEGIEAVVTHDVKHKDRVVIPKGAIAWGRVRLAESLRQPEPHFILGLEFSDVQSGPKRTSLWAYLNSYTSLATIESNIRTERTHSRSLLNRGRLDITEVETTTPLSLPGVGTFVFTEETAVLPAGFEMEWISMKPRGTGR